MTLTHSISDISLVSCAVNVLALLAFSIKAELRRSFSALYAFLGVRVASDALLNLLMHTHLPLSASTIYIVYFSIYWLSFFIGSIAIFFTVRQVFEYVMEPLQGLRRTGRVLFRWIAITSAIVVLTSSLHPYGFTLRAIPLGMIELMRCMSVLEFSLLAFLACSVHKLGLSFRNSVFGIGLGMGMLAATDMAVAAAARFGTSMVSYTSLFGEIGTLLVFATWCVYFFKTEPARKSFSMPATSPLLRWNEIANALNHPGGQIVITPEPQGFLGEVDRIVDRVMSRNASDAR